MRGEHGNTYSVCIFQYAWLVAHRDRLKKESRQIEIYRQLRILNPRNLPDMPRAMDQYPLLGLSDVPEIAEQWSLYIRCNAVDINGLTALQEWWQSCAPSPFQKRVLFLITQPTSGGDVERIFSQCGTISKRQHKLDDNIRRLRFMLQFHGDIEGRLLQLYCPWTICFSEILRILSHLSRAVAP